MQLGSELGSGLISGHFTMVASWATHSSSLSLTQVSYLQNGAGAPSLFFSEHCGCGSWEHSVSPSLQGNPLGWIESQHRFLSTADWEPVSHGATEGVQKPLVRKRHTWVNRLDSWLYHYLCGVGQVTHFPVSSVVEWEWLYLPRRGCVYTIGTQ